VLSTVDSGLTNLIHDHCSCSLFTLSSVGTGRLDVSTQAWTSHARREWVTTR